MSSRGSDKRLTALRPHEEANAMALANRGLVIGHARRMFGRVEDPDEAISRAWPGLYRAAQCYDPALGWTFGTYAARWICQALGRAAENETASIHVPYHAREVMRRAERLGLPLAAVAGDRLACVAAAAALPAVSHETEGHAWLSQAPDRRDGPAEAAERADDARAVRLAVARLAPRQRAVIGLRYGYGWTHQRIGKRLGYNKDWARRVEADAIGALRGAVA